MLHIGPNISIILCIVSHPKKGFMAKQIKQMIQKHVLMKITHRFNLWTRFHL